MKNIPMKITTFWQVILGEKKANSFKFLMWKIKINWEKYWWMKRLSKRKEILRIVRRGCLIHFMNLIVLKKLKTGSTRKIRHLRPCVNCGNSKSTKWQLSLKMLTNNYPKILNNSPFYKLLIRFFQNTSQK